MVRGREHEPMSELTATELEAAINRYLRSKSKGGTGSGTYYRTAKSALDRWQEWLTSDEIAELTDPDAGAQVLRRYAQHLSTQVGRDDFAASSAHTYYNIVSGFCSYCVRDGVLPSNPAQRERAREELPTDDSDDRQQFWDADTRDRFLQWLDDRAYEVIDRNGTDALQEIRDRAFGYLLAYSGVRGAEILRTSVDDREGRQGLRWRNVSFPEADAETESGTLRVFGKAQEWETTPLPRQAVGPIRQYYRVLWEPPGDWPVSPTEHAPSKYRAARERLADQGMAQDDIEVLLDEQPIDRGAPGARDRSPGSHC